MAQSLDSVLSSKIGIDNLLCPPQRSVSWWALVVITAFTIAESIRHGAPGTYETFVLASMSVLTLACYALFRIRLARLIQLSAADSENLTSHFRSTSAAALMITGMSLAACFYGIVFR
jgi:hypothetical protein